MSYMDEVPTCNEVAQLIIKQGVFPAKIHTKTIQNSGSNPNLLKKPEYQQGRCQIAYNALEERFVITVDQEQPHNGEVLVLTENDNARRITFNNLAKNGHFGFGRCDLVFSVIPNKKDEITSICDTLNRRASLVL